MTLLLTDHGCIIQDCESPEWMWLRDGSSVGDAEEADSAAVSNADQAEDLPSVGEVCHQAHVPCDRLLEARTAQEEASEEVTAKTGAVDRAKEARAAGNPQHV